MKRCAKGLEQEYGLHVGRETDLYFSSSGTRHSLRLLVMQSLSRLSPMNTILLSRSLPSDAHSLGLASHSTVSCTPYPTPTYTENRTPNETRSTQKIKSGACLYDTRHDLLDVMNKLSTIREKRILVVSVIATTKTTYALWGAGERKRYVSSLTGSYFGFVLTPHNVIRYFYTKFSIKFEIRFQKG